MKRLIAALLLSATPAAALDLSAMTETEREAFGSAVREYLMENPQVLVEAINALEVRQAEAGVENDRALVAANHDAIFEDGASWVGGNPEGDLDVVEFIDYRCTYCQQFNPEVQETVENDGNIRLILKELPILGEESELAARFTVAVLQIAGDEAYLAAHNALMGGMRGGITAQSLAALAGQIGVDSDEVMNRMQTESVSSVLRANQELAATLGVRGTPAFVIGDQMLRGMPRAGLAASIEAVREGS